MPKGHVDYNSIHDGTPLAEPMREGYTADGGFRKMTSDNIGTTMSQLLGGAPDYSAPDRSAEPFQGMQVPSKEDFIPYWDWHRGRHWRWHAYKRQQTLEAFSVATLIGLIIVVILIIALYLK